MPFLGQLLGNVSYSILEANNLVSRKLSVFVFIQVILPIAFGILHFGNTGIMEKYGKPP